MNAETKKDPGNILANLYGLLPDLESVYKDLHSHPELSMHEERTARIAADPLRAAGYEVTTGVGKTGVVGLLRNGDGPTIMLRADMDALPVKEATGKIGEIPTNHNPRFAPVIHPTLETGVEALVVAAQAWLSA